MAGAHLIEVLVNLALAWVAGSLIGLERTYNGRVAGFRTHGLVSLAALPGGLTQRTTIPAAACLSFPARAR